MIQYCPFCGKELERDSSFCNECGEKIPDEPMLTCPKCGEENKPKARFCKKCGDKIVRPDNMVVCPECGELCRDTSDFCMYCGEDLSAPLSDDDFDDSHLAYNNRVLGLSTGSVQPAPLKNDIAHASESRPPKKKMALWKKIGIGILALVLLKACADMSEPSYYSEGEYSGDVEPVLSEDEYKSACSTVSYRDISRNPNDYVGVKAVFTGEVVQVQESGKNVVLRVNVTRGSYSWDDTVYVTYEKAYTNESRILEDDIITMYGELQGIKTYTTIFGGEVSIPHLKAKYIVIQ